MKPSFNSRKPLFVSGLHNVGYLIAGAIWLVCLLMTFSQFLFEGEFTVVTRRLECEQPLNNRCNFVYLLRDTNGEQRESKLIAFRAGIEDLAPGNQIQKNRFRFNYQVNGLKVIWDEAWKFALLSLLALLPFAISRALTPPQ